MGWARLDDCYSDHPKIVAAGAFAELLDVRAILYCARYETDGQIPRDALSRLSSGITNPKARARKLVEVGRWREVEAGWEVVDYLEYNPSRADRETERSAARERMARARSGKRGLSDVRPNIDGTKAELRVTPSRPLTGNSSSDSIHDASVDNLDDDEISRTIRAVLERVADRRMLAADGTIRNRGRYRQKILDQLPDELDVGYLRTLIHDFDAPIEMLAGAVSGEPTPYLASYRRQEQTA